MFGSSSSVPPSWLHHRDLGLHGADESTDMKTLGYSAYFSVTHQLIGSTRAFLFFFSSVILSLKLVQPLSDTALESDDSVESILWTSPVQKNSRSD